MRLGQYFTLDEMTRTGTRALNKPNERQLVNLTRLVTLCLDPLREVCGPLKVTSGFRSEAVNKAVGGSPTSYHRHGLAADIQHDTLTVDELAAMVEAQGLPFDKLILEYARNESWIHWQLVEPDRVNRKEVYNARIVNGKMKYTRVM